MNIDLLFLPCLISTIFLFFNLSFFSSSSICLCTQAQYMSRDRYLAIVLNFWSEEFLFDDQASFVLFPLSISCFNSLLNSYLIWIVFVQILEFMYDYDFPPKILLGVYREIIRLDEIIGKKIIRRESDIQITSAADQMVMMSRQNNSFGQLPGMTTLNTITPCAACKLLRRRCAEECPFSPYFSPHEPHKFSAVHKVFGASNVSKLLMVH